MANPYGDTPIKQVGEGPPKSPYGDLPQSDWQPLADSGKPGWIDTLKTVDPGKVLKSTPQSIAGVAEAALMPIYRPGETLEGVGNLATAGVENFASNMPGFENIPTPQRDTLTSYLSTKYGTPEGLKEALETDPVGIIADAAGVLFGGLGVGRMAKAGAANALPKNLPNNMVKEIAKFPRRNLTNAEVDDLVEFMLHENIPFSAKGIERLDDIITTTGTKINRMIEKADKGQTIPRSELNDVLKEMRAETTGKTALAEKDVKIIDSVIDGWEQAIAAKGKPDFTLAELQKFKQDTYGKVYWRETDSNKKNVRNAALKAQALDAKARLEKEVPGIKEANKRQGMALELKPLAEGTTQRIERNTGTMGQGLGTGQGAAWGAGLEGINYAAGQPIPTGSIVPITTMIGATKGFMGGPSRKQGLAQAIYNARRQDPNLVDIPLAKAMAIYLARENQQQ